MLVRTDRARIFVDVPEAEAVFVRPGCPATVRTRASHGQDIEAQVQRISWILEPANRTLRAEIEMPAGDLVRPGMYAYAVIRVAHPATWTLPAGAVVVKDEGAFCYQVDNGRVRRTPDPHRRQERHAGGGLGGANRNDGLRGGAPLAIVHRLGAGRAEQSRPTLKDAEVGPRGAGGNSKAPLRNWREINVSGTLRVPLAGGTLRVVC